MSPLYREIPPLLVVAPLTAAALALLLARLHRRRGVTALRVLVAVALCGYVAGIFAHTVLPIYLDKPGNDVPWHAYLHLVPLVGTEPADMVKNVVVFVPFGVLLPLVAPTRSVLRVLLAGFVLSLLMETAQLVNALVAHGGHVADVNDLLANTLGAPLGYGLLRLGERLPGVARIVRAATWPSARADEFPPDRWSVRAEPHPTSEDLMTATTTQRSLDVPGATIVYDVRGPLPTADGQPPLVMIGQPMDARGFGTLASHFTDRTVVTYDPRGIGRSTRDDGSTLHDPRVQADDLHALVTALDAGPVDLFGSSGGAVTALAWVTAHPHDVRTLVAHEPPLIDVLPDAEHARAASARVDAAYQERGWGHGMAAFIAFTSWQGPFPADFLTELPDPAMFGMPADDDGSRDDPLLSGASAPVTAYEPDVDALRSGPTRVVLAAGIESEGIVTWRTTHALAERLGAQVAVFPSNHGGFLGDEFGMPGQPEAFAARLREVLAETAG